MHSCGRRGMEIQCAPRLGTERRTTARQLHFAVWARAHAAMHVQWFDAVPDLTCANFPARIVSFL
jgi:hypothetical protein